MKLIRPSFEIMTQAVGEVGMLKHIEACGRVAWRSEDRTTDDSYVRFVDMLKGRKHGSVLEHGTVYLYSPEEDNNNGIFNRYYYNEYSLAKKVTNKLNRGYSAVYVTTNYRVLFENGWLDDLKYQCGPTEFHEKRISVRFIMDRVGSQSFVRHRNFSFTQESTRYCNYSKDKFGNKLTFILPVWTKLSEGSYFRINGSINGSADRIKSINDGQFLHALIDSEERYFNLINGGWSPEEARVVLPLGLKTELIMTGFESDWKHFFELRCDKSAHPQARELAIPLRRKIFNE